MVPVESMRVMERGKRNAMRAHMDEMEMMLACLRVREMSGMRKRRTEQSHDEVVRGRDPYDWWKPEGM